MISTERSIRNTILLMASMSALCSSLMFHNIENTPRHIITFFSAEEERADVGSQYPIMGSDDIMKPKAHGTSQKAAQKDLLYGMDYETADRICNFNRRYAEYKGYATNFLNFLERQSRSKKEEQTTTKFYDSVTGNLLFTAPIGRTVSDFVAESRSHGWPSFRDEEVNWKYVRCLEDGECVSTTGTHLGHNLPDSKGNRYCINLVSIAGRPIQEENAYPSFP